MKSVRETSSYRHFYEYGNKSFAVFIHGLGGTYDNSYWGKVPVFLKNELSLNNCDFIFLRYRSNKRPGLPDFLNSALSLESLPSVDLIIDEIATTIYSINREHKYESGHLLGHSMGGLIANEIGSNDELRCSLGICSMAALSSPTKSPALSKIINAVYLGTNPQISYLSKRSNYDSFLCSLSSALKVTVIASSGDPVITCKTPRSDVPRQAVPGGHTWMASVDSVQSPGYLAIKNWLCGCLQG